METKIKHCRIRLRVMMAAVIAGVICFHGQVVAQPDYSAWVDHGIVYSATTGDAYYPSVIYDADGFGNGTPLYKMWYSDGGGEVYVVESINGTNWSAPTRVSGFGNDAHHVQVLYDPDGFNSSSGPYYKIWYWDTNTIYSIDAIAYAESNDGINWTNDQAIAQDDVMKLVTSVWPDWNRGSYGPIDVLYQPGALNSGSNPWDYSYVMFYDGTNGGNEFTGLAYSSDGRDWTAYSFKPLWDEATTAAWDCSDSSYGTVYQDSNGYHFWYSGGGADDGSGGCQDSDTHEGIGYAFSSDGKIWYKDTGNHIFHIADGVSYRDSRVYTPAVVNDYSGFLKMYYSARAVGGVKKIGLAKLSLSIEVDIDIMPRRFPNIIRLNIDEDECDDNRRLSVAILTTADFNALSVDDSTVTLGDPALSGVATPIRSRARDVDRDGDRDMLLIFFRCDSVANDALNVNSTELVLTGNTFGGTPITGTDSVIVVQE